MNKSEIITMYEIPVIILHLKILQLQHENIFFEHEFGINKF